MSGASFDSTKTPLQELLSRAHNGKLQLLDFQREWVWDDNRIRSLLASVSVSYPIGAVMLLQTGDENVRFKPRPVQGSQDGSGSTAPETLILDGQVAGGRRMRFLPVLFQVVIMMLLELGARQHGG